MKAKPSNMHNISSLLFALGGIPGFPESLPCPLLAAPSIRPPRPAFTRLGRGERGREAKLKDDDDDDDV